MKHLHHLLLAGAAALVLSAAARAADWTEDYPAALARARQEHKLLLLDFTGSDWCIWCKRIDAEILDTPKFKEFADKKLILVTLDFPRQKEQTDALKAQNKGLSDKYSVEGFPTLIVLDPDEKLVLKQEGYLEGGPDALIALFPKASK
jgi:protein disulfide-isomerase